MQFPKLTAASTAYWVGEGSAITESQPTTGNLDLQAKKLGVFVNSTADFVDQPKVANGVSDLMVEVFGDAGKHARFAVGTNVLPLDLAVEVDAVVELN